MSGGLRSVFAVLALVALVAAGCGDGGRDADAEPRPTAPTTTLPPGGLQPTEARPLRVTFAGDSVMAEFAPAMTAALEGTGLARSRFVLAPSLARDGATRVIWHNDLERHDPDLIVLLVGFWEDKVVGDEASSQPGWTAQYRRDIVDPFLDLITGQGAKVLWIGMAAARNPDVTARFVRLNDAYRQSADARDDVDYLPGGQYLSGPDGGYADSVVSEVSGQLVRIRRTDGLHLCPAGIDRLGVPVLERITAQWNIGVTYGWQQADWRRPPLLHAPDECPPPV